MRLGLKASFTALCLLLALGGPLFAAQAGAGGVQPRERYRIKPGDRVQILVFPQGAIYNQTLVVQPDGRIYYPVVGEIVAEGKTVPEIQQAIFDGLREELRNYRVTVTVDPAVVREERVPGRVTILGAIRSPGVQPMQENLRLIELLANAGGPTEQADQQRILITRGESAVAVDVTTAAGRDFALQPGDTVIVPDLPQGAGLTVYAAGAVTRPGPVTFLRPSTILDLMKEAGIGERANLRDARLRRAGQAEDTVIDLHRLWIEGDLSLNLRLAQGDVLVIPENVGNGVYVLGAVARPDFYPLKGGERLIDILVRGGQPNEGANLGKVTLTRRNPDGTTATLRLDLKKLQSQGEITVATMPMMAGDIIVVPQRPPSRAGALDRVLQLTAYLSILTTLQDLTGIDLFGGDSSSGSGSGSGN